MTDRPDLSIVVPLFNEEEAVEHLYTWITSEIGKLDQSCEVIFVDDGSTDRTFDVASKLVTPGGPLRVLKLRGNAGQTAAMVAGFDAARGELIVTMDGDLQNSPADIPRLLEKISEGYDVVSGWRVDRKDDFLRVRLSQVANGLISLISGVRLHDYGCSLKVYRAKFLKSLRFYGDMHRFFPAIVSSLLGARTTEIPVRHYPRVTGKSKYGLNRTFKVMVDLVSIQMITRFHRQPLYWFALCSAPFFILGMILSAFAVFEYAHSTEHMYVVPATVVLVFSGAFHFILEGLIAEFVAKTGEADHKSVIGYKVVELGEERHAV